MLGRDYIWETDNTDSYFCAWCIVVTSLSVVLYVAGWEGVVEGWTEHGGYVTPNLRYHTLLHLNSFLYI